IYAEQYAEAEHHARESNVATLKTNHPYRISFTLNLLGLALTLNGKLVEARTVYEQAAAAWRKLGHAEALATALNGLGRVLSALGELHSAEAHFREAFEIAKAQDIQAGLLHAQIGLAYLSSAPPQQAAEGIRELLEQARVISVPKHIQLDW